MSLQKSPRFNRLKREDGWRDVVKGVEVESRLLGLEERWDRMGKHAGLEGDPERMSKVIGSVEEGFRWHLWWVWVEFY